MALAAALFVAACVAMYAALSRRPPARPGGWPATQAGRTGGNYFLGGRVQRPGAYTMAGQPVTIRQAIVAAGGPDLRLGGAAYVTVHRRHPHEHEDEIIKIRLGPLLDGGVNDEALWPNDVIIVHDKR